MAVTFKGNGASAFWGVPGSVYSGRVVSASVDTSGEEVELSNSDGETDGLAMLNEKDEINLEVIYDSTFTPPARGATITVGSVTGVVLNVSKKWQNKGWRACTVKATDWKTMTE
jgi:hypothetical protein